MGWRDRLKAQIEERQERKFEGKLGKERISAYGEEKEARREQKKAERYTIAKGEEYARSRQLQAVREQRLRAEQLRREARDIRHPSRVRVREATVKAKQMAGRAYQKSGDVLIARLKEEQQAEQQTRQYIQKETYKRARAERKRYPRPSTKAPPMIQETRYGGRREITGLGYGVATEYAPTEKQLSEIQFFEPKQQDFFGERKTADYFGIGTKKTVDFIGTGEKKDLMPLYAEGKKKKTRYY